MRIAERLQTVRKLFLDTAPIIYFVEGNERYRAAVQIVFDCIDRGSLIAVTSPVTLAECLVLPYRMERSALVKVFSELIVNGCNTVFMDIDQETATAAARLRAEHNLSLADSFQLAIALNAGCDAFLTNDIALKRIAGLDVIVLEDMESE